MNNQETQGTTNDVDPASVDRVVMLAQDCPSDYPNGSLELRDLKEFVDLSKALVEAGFPFLAKAVLGGIAWSRRIANGHSLRDEEEHASYPGGLASVLFISAEPVVGPMPTLGEYLGGIAWVITGGESGPDARPADPDWFRSIRDQCEMHNVPFHFKQWGEFDEHQKRVGKKAAGRLLDGEEHDGVPLLAAGF